MVTVGVRELKQQASELIRQVREDGREFQVSYRGEVVALVVPVTRPQQTDIEDAWEQLDILAAEIGARWPEGVTSVEAVAEGRA
ncbi:MAG: type II toxin-antitoxin system prevent-host-death family antitoxin [Chloroflexi bacterium]|nr:type II toxin-antitoxin system prevent-host-death family antitoxin [Chloroflexota bacterium]